MVSVRRAKIRLTLEMLSPRHLIPAEPHPRLLAVATPDGDPTLAELFRTIGAAHLWSWDSWSSYGSAPAKRHWVFRVDQRPGGLLTLLAHPTRDVEIVTFGLTPAVQGQGLGGWALTLAIDLAWTAYGGGVSRVWLRTNNFDHPRALVNYQKRGFVVTGREVLTITVPDDWSAS